ncbi:protein-tyrosine phosphatase-like protein [Mycena galericulata]|nr:protein-tyrosine phosphatase-like protein [Mycena galericulata]KAJ7450669.1 protein-tyrosine phosphatase-like protein [Mycena galericulata]
MFSQARESSRLNSAHREDITEILPNLFLGSQAGALNHQLLRRHGITHILSVMNPNPAHSLQQNDDGFRRMIVPVQDWPDEELLTHFKRANSFIDDARVIAGEGVLVHCYQGVSRSATVVAAYLMASHPHTPDYISAIKFLQSLRPIVEPNAGFLDQLALYGRCGCNMDDNFTAVEAWRAVRHRRWEVPMGRGTSEKPKCWAVCRRRLPRWIVYLFG